MEVPEDDAVNDETWEDDPAHYAYRYICVMTYVPSRDSYSDPNEAQRSVPSVSASKALLVEIFRES